LEEVLYLFCGVLEPKYKEEIIKLSKLQCEVIGLSLANTKRGTGSKTRKLYAKNLKIMKFLIFIL